MFNFELFSNEEFRGSGAWSHGLDAAAVFGAPRAAEAKGLAGVLARGCSKGGGGAHWWLGKRKREPVGSLPWARKGGAVME
jgi:hypothetical protein